MTRLIHTHMVENAAHELVIEVMDEPGTGNANHIYDIQWVDKTGRLNARLIPFQNGPIKEVGVNGITNEALLAIVIDRLRGFQSGPYACRSNADALLHCESALFFLQSRTRECLARNVEGTHQL